MIDAPVIKDYRLICDLKKGENNPRNSEGDFARLKNGDILFAWCRYEGGTDHDDSDCNIAGMISHDNGESFEMLPYPLVTAASHGVINVMSVSLERLQDGTLCLFYLCKHTPYSEVWVRMALPEDETRFGEPRLLIPCKNGIYYVINNCRVCVAPDGRVYIPVAEHPVKRVNGTNRGIYYGSIRMFGGDSDLSNFSPLSQKISMPYPGHTVTGLQEPGVTVLPDGRLYMYARTDRHFQYECFSSDGGRTWTAAVPSSFTSPDSPMLILRNPYSGIYYSVWNPVPNYNGRLTPELRNLHAGRTPIVLAASEDGLNWSSYTVLEDDPFRGYCYPAIIFLSKKELLISFCCGGEEDRMCLTRTNINKIVLK